MIYPEIFKEKMIRRMTWPDAISASALSRETNVAQSTLSKWLASVSYKPYDTGALAMNSDKKSKRPQDWTAGEKLNAVLESARLDEESLGAFLRENGRGIFLSFFILGLPSESSAYGKKHSFLTVGWS